MAESTELQERELRRALEQCAERYRSFVRHSTEGIYCMEFEPGIPTSEPVERQARLMYERTVIAECNDIFAEVYGFESADEIVGKPFTVVAQYNEGLRDLLETFVRTGYRMVDRETREVLADGTVRYSLNNAHGIIKDGLLVRAWGTDRDVTRWRRTEAALREVAEGVSAATGEAFFRSLVRHLATALEVDYAFIGEFQKRKTQSVQVIAASKHGEIVENFSYDLADTPCADVYRGMELCIHPSNVCEKFPKDAVLEKWGIESYAGMPLIETGGGVRGLLVILDRAPMTDTETVRSLLRIFGTRASMEWERKESMEALRESEERYRRLVEFSPTPIIVHQDARFAYANKAAADLFGAKSAAGLVGRPLADLLPSTTRSGVLDVPVQDRPGPLVEEKLTRADGSTIDVEMVAIRTSIAGRTAVHVVIRDVTEEKLAKEQREQLIRELEQKNAELERFTYTVSHELKSPLITITGFLGIIRQDLCDNLPPHVVDDLEVVSRAASQMSRRLDDLLELSRIGRVASPSERVSLKDIVDEVLELVSGSSAARGVDVHVADELPTVSGDRTRLLEVVQNLVENAIKYGDSENPRLDITACDNGEEVVVSVRDNGKGIPPEYHERVFRLFEQLDPDTSGTGIGLALAKRIVEIHGGRIWIESEGEGCGSVFHFSLPSIQVSTETS